MGSSFLVQNQHYSHVVTDTVYSSSEFSAFLERGMTLCALDCLPSRVTLLLSVYFQQKIMVVPIVFTQIKSPASQTEAKSFGKS